MDPSFSDVVNDLKVPDDFNKYTECIEFEDTDALNRLHEWRDKVPQLLAELKSLLEKKLDHRTLDVPGAAHIGAVVLAFVNEDDPWVHPASCNLARDILDFLSIDTVDAVTHILVHIIKPLFQSNPHPRLNAGGRSLPRVAGGADAVQDVFECQKWKTHPGVSNVLLWCVEHIDDSHYERLWPLLIPPVMTLLDDYQIQQKLRGVQLVQVMLQRVPVSVLKRTGIDILLQKASLSSIRESPQLLSSAIRASLTLTLLTTKEGTSERFDQLCTLVGDGIIGSIWTYSSTKHDVMTASLKALPPVTRALGIGNARFMRALIPQLVHPLTIPAPVVMQEAALQALDALCDECKPCIHRWKGTILDGVVKAWVRSCDSSAAPDIREFQGIYLCEALRANDVFTASTGDLDNLRLSLGKECKKLVGICPSAKSVSIGAIGIYHRSRFSG
ncbi:hypothetical protein FISHEDRAFT_48262 [Fistulina hepatica ATCC 64428]|uniref:ARM repeat-containing protein n=1 Tax=Fistulina hepatica ATCC 64428 TaxID=1128425 RepID=A0A0D7A6G3_9AGAR|nr:hypothetical protein FISHEDRAFT_48262 [Fistulina hepatica ATCC 64428]